MDNVHVGDVAKYSFYDQVTLQAKVKEDSGAVTWAEPMMVRFPMWMKGHAVGRDLAAVFIGGTLYQIKGDSHSYVQTWRVHGGQLKHRMGCSVRGRRAEPLVRTLFPEHPPSLNFGANHVKKWIQHPQKPPIPFLSPHNPHRRGVFLGGGGGQRVRAQLEQR